MQTLIEKSPDGEIETASGGALLSQIRDGDEQAAELLYNRFAGRLRLLANAKLSKLLQSRLDADDIVQSVFRRFFEATSEGAYNCPTIDDLWNVLMVITLNRLRTEEAFQRAGKRDIRRNVNMEALEKVTSFSHSRFAASLLREGVEGALAKLPGHFGQVTKLRLEGHTVAEIAQLVGRSKRTVERILQESLTQLREMFEPDIDGPNDEVAEAPPVSGGN